MNGVHWFGGVPLRRLGRRTWTQFNEDDVLTYAASLAFHAFLALFPMLVFLLAIVSFLDMPWLFDSVMAWAETVVPEALMTQVEEVITTLQSRRRPGLLSLGILGAIWATSGGIRSTMTVLNRAYDVEESRSALRRYALSIGYAVALGLLILAGAALMLFGPRIGAWIAEQAGLGDLFLSVWSWLRYPVAALFLVVGTAVAYSMLPAIEGFRWLTPGAVLAVGLWFLLSAGFRVYMDNFGRFDVMYGSIGAVVALLLYFWLSSIVLLLGGELNAVVQRHGAARRSEGAPA